MNGWPVGNRTLVKRLSSAYSTIELQAIRIWWAGAVTIHSLKDGFYRPTARTTSFTCPLLVDRKRIELLPSPCKGDVLPLSLAARYSVHLAGLAHCAKEVSNPALSTFPSCYLVQVSPACLERWIIGDGPRSRT